MNARLVIYHGNCYDGVTAAWVCWLRFGENATYLPLNYSDAPPDVRGRDVVIVDFSFKRDVMLKIKAEAGSFLVLDHHKTAQEALDGIEGAHFDMERSGAGMAWDYFFGEDGKTYERHALVNYVEDRDLWRFSLPDAKEVTAWIQSFDIELRTWIDTVGPQFNVERARTEGVSLLRIQDKYVKQICANAELRRIGKKQEYVGPYVETSILMSEVCDHLIHNYPGSYPFAFYSFRRKDGKHQYGLRSRGDFDVSVIAKEYGGGGHKNAAGFELDAPLPSGDDK